MAYLKSYRPAYEGRNFLLKALSSFWSYRADRIYFLLSLFLQVGLWYFAWRIYKIIGADLFVAHYNVDTGVDSVGNGSRVFLTPTLAAAVLVLNFIVVSFAGLRRSHNFHFLAHASGIASVLVQLFAILVLLSLYLINFIA